MICSRPHLSREMRRARSSTRRCLDTEGSDIRNGLASAVTRVFPCFDRRSRMRLRVGSASAKNTAVILSRCLATRLTIRCRFMSSKVNRRGKYPGHAQQGGRSRRGDSAHVRSVPRRRNRRGYSCDQTINGKRAAARPTFLDSRTAIPATNAGSNRVAQIVIRPLKSPEFGSRERPE